MNGIALCAVLLLDPFGAEPLPDVFGASGVNVDTCQCGQTCECVNCTCANCPHLVKAEEHTERAAALVKGTAQPKTVLSCPLSVTVADRGCDPCDRWEREALPQLASRGWLVGKHYTVRRVPLGSEPTPTFVWRGKGFAASGYGGWESWRADLAGAMGLQAEATVRSGSVRPSSTGVRAGAVTTWAVNPRPAAAPVRLPGQHSHRCSSCGTIWSHGSDSHGSYRDHQCPNCGRLQWQQYRGPMNGGYVRSAPVMRYQPIVMRSCPNGRCP
jgi:hypothetical protein